MQIARLWRHNKSLAMVLPGSIWRAWRLKPGDMVIVELIEPGRMTVRPLEVRPFDPVPRSGARGR